MDKGNSPSLHHRGGANRCASIARPKAGWCKSQSHAQPLESICLTASVQGHPRTTLEPSEDGGDVPGTHTPPERERCVAEASSFNLASREKQCHHLSRVVFN